MKNALLLFIPFFITSCDFDDNGNMSINWFGYLLILAFVAFIIIMIAQTKNYEKEIKEKGIDLSLFKSIGKYIGGHPSINNEIDYVSIKKEEGCITLYETPPMKIPSRIPDADIPIKDIDDISVNDASEIERKITVGRIFLVGIFALGWRKKKKHEIAFVVIDWHKGKFNNSTTFCFEGKAAMNLANTARNELIKMCE
jgi:hypothetical protein